MKKIILLILIPIFIKSKNHSVDISLFKSVDCYSSKCIMWETQSEIDNSHFELQRSIDGIIFNTIDTIESKADGGNSSTMLNYYVSDNDIDGIFYYRLKIFALDGTFETSNVILVEYKSDKKMRVIFYKNPTITGYTNWVITDCIPGCDFKIKIINIIGETIFSYKLITKEPPYKGVLSTSEMKNGIYFCSFILDGYEFNFKLIIS